MSKKPKDKDMFENIRDKFDTWDGVEISIWWSTHPDWSKRKAKFYYSTKNKPLSIDSNNVVRDMEIEFSSCESDDNELLNRMYDQSQD